MAQIPGQVEPLVDPERLTTPAWYTFFLEFWNNLIGAWTQISAPIAPSVGSFTTASATVRYRKIGKTVNVAISALITAPGSGSAWIGVTLPWAARAPAGFSGRENNVTGKALLGWMYGGGNVVWIINADGTSAIGVNYNSQISGTFETM